MTPKSQLMTNLINQIFEQKPFAPTTGEISLAMRWLTTPEIWEVAEGVGVTNYGPDRDQAIAAIVAEIELFLEN